MTVTTETLRFYNSQGNQLSATRRQLLRLEAQKFDIKLMRKLTGDREGTYWLLSDRPGKVPMILQVCLHHGAVSQEWTMSFCTNGIASYSHFNIENALNGAFGKQHGDQAIPENVAELARQHVAYRPDGKSTDNAATRHTVGLLKASVMRRRLKPNKQLTAAQIDQLVTATAGRRMGIFELNLLIMDALGTEVDERLLSDVAVTLVPLRSWPRYVLLNWRFAGALSEG